MRRFFDHRTHLICSLVIRTQPIKKYVQRTFYLYHRQTGHEQTFLGRFLFHRVDNDRDLGRTEPLLSVPVSSSSLRLQLQILQKKPIYVYLMSLIDGNTQLSGLWNAYFLHTLRSKLRFSNVARSSLPLNQCFILLWQGDKR